MPYTIDKQFHFEYGHRVWSQELNSDFCAVGDDKCACRFMHGHSGKVHVFARSVALKGGMVVDFKHLGWIKDFIDEYLDHKFIIDIEDPLINNLINGTLNYDAGGMMYIKPKDERAANISLERVTVVDGGDAYGWRPIVDFLDGPLRELYEGLFLIDRLPTSENMCKWLYDLTNEKMKQINVDISRIDWHETAKSRSTYINTV